MKAHTEDELREIIQRVLSENESRCLDDDNDREVVLRELLKALSRRCRDSLARIPG